MNLVGLQVAGQAHFDVKDGHREHRQARGAPEKVSQWQTTQTKAQHDTAAKRKRHGINGRQVGTRTGRTAQTSRTC